VATPIAQIPAARRVQRTFLILTLGNTLAASFIWGVNTLFLLDAGLTNLEAFAANAFFTLGMVVFEVPTGVVADTVGRRASYLLGTLVLSVGTLLYWLMWVWTAPFWAWALASVLLGLGFTSLSVSLGAYTRMRHVISSFNHARLRELACKILSMHKPAEIESMVRSVIGLQPSHRT